VEIEVDTQTGELEILNIVSAIDAGKVLNPQLAREQIIGGVIQGLGSALFEGLVFDEKGRLLNPSFVDHKIPTAKDIPVKTEQIFIETPQPDGPYGARGIAEHPMISVPSAVANALYDALGIDFKALPLTAERVYHDSVFLMRISDAVQGLPGIADAVVALATPTNVENLEKIGFSSPELSAAGPNDLVIAIDAADEDAISAALARVEELLHEKVEETGKEARPRPATLAKALKVLPDANLALISVPGRYAAREARMALRRGLHVMLFSDNVRIEDEIALKDEAIGRGLLPARVRQRGPVRSDRDRGGVRDRDPGDHIPDPSLRRRDLSGDRDRRTRPLGCCRREDDHIRDRGPGRRSEDGGHRRRLQGPGPPGGGESGRRAREDRKAWDHPVHRAG